VLDSLKRIESFLSVAGLSERDRLQRCHRCTVKSRSHPPLVETPGSVLLTDGLGEEHRRPCPVALRGRRAGEKRRRPVAGSRRVAVGVSHQLIGFFRGRIQADWVVDGLLALRMAGSGCLHRPNCWTRYTQVLNLVVAASPPGSRESTHCCSHRPAGFQLSSDARLAARWIPAFNLRSETFGDGGGVFQGQPLEVKVAVPLGVAAAVAASGRGVSSCSGVEADHPIAPGQKPLGTAAPNEPAARDQKCSIRAVPLKQAKLSITPHPPSRPGSRSPSEPPHSIHHR